LILSFELVIQLLGVNGTPTFVEAGMRLLNGFDSANRSWLRFSALGGGVAVHSFGHENLQTFTCYCAYDFLGCAWHDGWAGECS